MRFFHMSFVRKRNVSWKLEAIGCLKDRRRKEMSVSVNALRFIRNSIEVQMTSLRFRFKFRV